jgi:hypothetical protein
MLISQLMRVKLFVDINVDVSQSKRENEYYERSLISQQFSKETRVLGALPYFISRLRNSIVSYTALHWKAESKGILLENMSYQRHSINGRLDTMLSTEFGGIDLSGDNGSGLLSREGCIEITKSSLWTNPHPRLILLMKEWFMKSFPILLKES